MMPDSNGKDVIKSPRIGDTVMLLHVKPSKKTIYKGIVTWVSESRKWLTIGGYHGIINIKFTKTIEKRR